MKLAVRAAQPTLRNRRVRIERTLEGDFLEVGRERAHHDEQIGVLRCRGHPQFRRDWSGDFHRVHKRFGKESDPVAKARIGDRAGGSLRVRRHGHVGWMQVKFGPAGARQRPLVLVPLDEFLPRMTHLQQHFRLLGPAGVLALEEMVEEFLLQADAVVRVEVRPMLDTVALEPFLLPLKIAARMQPLPAPVGGRKQRRLDLAPVRHA